jgi:hypothetical protein
MGARIVVPRLTGLSPGDNLTGIEPLSAWEDGRPGGAMRRRSTYPVT